ncbi:hypothetical protein B0H10DRAFT_1975165 [Mycena sp. CBHHK59/15]|nr:hypothetical protein B0H10DRAFT_1975165 [Mycena sp. CBHHK59/15]
MATLAPALFYSLHRPSLAVRRPFLAHVPLCPRSPNPSPQTLSTHSGTHPGDPFRLSPTPRTLSHTSQPHPAVAYRQPVCLHACGGALSRSQRHVTQRPPRLTRPARRFTVHTPLPAPALCSAFPMPRRHSSHLTLPPLTAQVCRTSQRSPSLRSRSRLPPQPTRICPAFMPSCPMLLGSLLPAVAVTTKSATSLFVSCDYDANPFAGASARPTVRCPPTRLHRPSYNTATVIGALVVLPMSPGPRHRALAAHTGVRRRKRKDIYQSPLLAPVQWLEHKCPGSLPESHTHDPTLVLAPLEPIACSARRMGAKPATSRLAPAANSPHSLHAAAVKPVRLSIPARVTPPSPAPTASSRSYTLSRCAHYPISPFSDSSLRSPSHCPTPSKPTALHASLLQGRTSGCALVRARREGH